MYFLGLVMIVRWVRALALAVVVLLGWGGVATAQSAIYNFSFNQAGLVGGGNITIDSATKVVQSVDNFFINGFQYYLARGGVGPTVQGKVRGTAPQLNSLTTGSIFYSGVANYPKEFTVAANPSNARTGMAFNFYSSSGSELVEVFNNNTIQGGATAISAATESFSQVAAPIPGAGLLSWLIAALIAAGVYGWARLQHRAPKLVLSLSYTPAGSRR